jgi:SNF2 family DNA or RNA helicase
MSLEEWQRALRIEYGEEQAFTMVNVGDHPVFSTFEVTNPATQRTYRVAIRGEEPGRNYCSCPDFTVNTLGVCKHIACVIAKLRRGRTTKKLLRENYQPSFSEVYVEYGNERTVRLSLGTDHTAKLRALAKTYFTLDGTLRAGGYARFGAFMNKAGALKDDIRIYDDALEYIGHIRDRTRRERIIDKKYPVVTPRGRAGGPAVRGVKATLYPYQYEGARFAARAGRAIIADEMGLGKTLQAIAAAEIMAAQFGVEKVLVVCPTSVKYQWKHEIERFTDRTVQVLEGLAHKRREQYATDAFYRIAGYEQVYRDVDDINDAAIDLVVLDETQRIKNWRTRTAQSIKRLCSPYALALTGTPLENRLEELHSIVEFIDRYRLGPLFKFLHAHQLTDEVGKVVGYRHLGSIGKTLRPILIRRTKAEVQQQLPGRVKKNLFVTMTKEQAEYHEENRSIVARLVAKWRRHRFLSEADQRRLMICLQNMRMACDNTFLLDKQTRNGPKSDEAVSIIGDILSDPAKKVVVFSQWQRMQQLLVEKLEEARIGYRYLHGGVPGHRRRELITSFRNDPDVRVFLSTDAGGTGLNLQSASAVINMDLPWNPAVLEQRIGRVHRIGQKRSVQVINLVSEGTIEQGMLKVLAFKKSVFAGVLDGGQDTVFMGETRLSKFMKEVSAVSDEVEKTPAAVPSMESEGSADEGRATAASRSSQEAQTEALSKSLRDLLTAGTAIVQRLAGATGSDNGGDAMAQTGGIVEVDPATGRPSLRIPLPEPEVIQGALSALTPLLQHIASGLSESAKQRRTRE